MQSYKGDSEVEFLSDEEKQSVDEYITSQMQW